MTNRLFKCDHCDKRADVKLGNGPEYLCAECWMKFYGKRGKTNEQKTNGV